MGPMRPRALFTAKAAANAPAQALRVAGLRGDPRPPALLIGGVLAGVMGTIAAVGGPPLALLYQHAPGAQVRGTLSGLFFLGTIVSLAALPLWRANSSLGRDPRGGIGDATFGAPWAAML